MVKHTQKSSTSKGFWQPIFNGEVLQECVYYWKTLAIGIPETDLSGLNDGDRVYIEDDTDPLHLVEHHAENDYTPLSGDVKSSPGPVIWKEDGEIHYISHTE